MIERRTDAGKFTDAVEPGDRRAYTACDLGRERAGRLLGWLLEADLALKGASSSPPRARLVLEQLIVRLSKAAAPRQAGPAASTA